MPHLSAARAGRPGQKITRYDGSRRCQAFDAGSAGVKPARPPRYIIEYLKDTTQGKEASTSALTSRAEAEPTFRITAMGFGPRLDTRAVVQIEYRRSK